jgi:glucose/arabinose dehydrogenase/plastocyanin/lysophospholipase L1-like esterase/HEAT repeat protein
MTRFATVLYLLAALTGLGTFAAPATAAEPVTFEKGDHVTFIGNALPERMNHFGWFETLLHDRFPQKELVVRSLGYAGDMVDSRLRVWEYGGQDQWLKRTKTDVIFAFWGFNESFRGEAGLDKFKKSLVKFIDHARNKKYNGQSHPRLVLFSPIAAEAHEARDLPDARPTNRRLAMYTQAMQQVAQQKNVPFVDLFHPSRRLYQQHEQKLTFNGVHLDEWGYKQLAPAIDRQLFGPRDESIRWKQLAPLRRAINDKNWYWFQRYRVNDGFNVFGARSRLKYKQIGADGKSGDDVPTLTNREVMQREMEVLEQQVANRDKRVWHVARGETGYTVKDDNLPEQIEVKTNLPGDQPGGKHKFPSPEEAMAKMDLADGFQVNCFASEQQFPSLANPVQMAFDTKGRLWVATWQTYPNWQPQTETRDKLLILEDTDNDGQADKRTVFADDLSNPTGFEFYNGGVLIANAPYLMFLKDTDGDNKADIKKRYYSHFSSADTHHTINSFVYGPGGGLHFAEGVFHQTQIETPHGPVRSRHGTQWRLRPDQFDMQRKASMAGFLNPHGHVFNRWGQGFSFCAASARPYHNTPVSGYIPFPDRHPEAPTLYEKRTRPVAGAGIISSEHFPEKMQGRLLVANVIGLRGIMQYNLVREGTGYTAKEADQVLIRSSSLNFRPVDIQTGPDGAIYFLDWQNPIIGHAQHHIRDPNRDSKHGRVYRISHKTRPLTKPHKIDGQPIDHLLDLLKERDNHVRYRAKIELGERDHEKVVQALDQWVKQLDPKAARYEHHLTEALWTYQWHNTPNQPLLERVLNADHPKARAAAARVAGYWRDRLDDPLALLAETVNDENGLVRLETVRMLSYFVDSVRAAEIALQAVNHEVDSEMDYTLTETIKALQPAWRAAIRAGKPFAQDNPAGLKRLLGSLSKKELVQLPHMPAVDRRVLMHPDVSGDHRRAALEHLAEAQGTTPLELLVDKLGSGQTPEQALSGLTALLDGFDARQLAPLADRFAELAKAGSTRMVRQAAMMGLMTARGAAKPAWTLVEDDPDRVMTFLDAVAAVSSKKVRASAYPYVRRLMFELPVADEQGQKQSRGIWAYYYNTKPANAKQQTFASMKTTQIVPANQVGLKVADLPNLKNNFALKFEGGLQVEKAGRYTFHLASDDGARLYLDGQELINHDGTHGPTTKKAGVDLSAGMHQLAVTYFQGTGGKALSLKWAGPGFEATPLTGEALRMNAGGPIHRRAIGLLAALPREPKAKFQDLAKALVDTGQVLAAGKALSGMAPKHWDASLAEDVAKKVHAYGLKQSESLRADDTFRQVVAFARKLLDRGSMAEARSLDRQLAELVVQVVVIKAVPEELLYDVEAFTVEAGKPVEIRFINPTNMAHNLLITKPGKMEAVGKAAQQMAAKPNAMAKGYVPEAEPAASQVLWHTDLLDAGESETLRFTAPKKVGDYPYVCTFPGHYLTMNGTMHVKKNN